MNYNQLKIKIQSASIVEKFIYINLFVFIVAVLISAFGHLNQSSKNVVLNYLGFNANDAYLYAKPYLFITYGFLHLDFIHILFNLIGLYYIGNLFISFFSPKEFIIYYVLGAIFGALFFLLSFYYFPVFNAKSGFLIGASASVSAIFVGLATYMPNYEINLRLIGYIKLWILAVVFVFLSVVLIRNGNEGGQIAHIGGAFIGFILSKYFIKNNTTIKKSKRNKSNLKAVYSAKNKSKDFGLSNHQKSILKQRKIDTLLDKISKSGYESLSQKERDFLAKAND